jgi:hypothetical protein
LSDFAAIGIDTNILKALRRDVTFADRVFLTLAQNKVTLVVPAQTVVEFWNNHQVFASDDWNGYRNQLGQLSKRIESDNLGGSFRKEIQEIARLVELLTSDLQETKSPEYLNRSRELMQSMLETARVPMVSRTRFAELARIRSSSKLPPGFADDKLKAASYGDFFVWCDFLLGTLYDPVASSNRQKCAWVTDDSKPDWKTGTRGHPALIEEFRWASERDLSVLSFAELKSLVADVEAEVGEALPGDNGEA